jgi:hypothetical protein
MRPPISNYFGSPYYILPLLTSCPPTYYFFHPLVQVSLETVGVVISRDLAGPEVENAVAGVAAVSVPVVVVVVADSVAAFVVVFVAPVSVAAVFAVPAVVFAAVVSVADIFEPQAAVCIALAFEFSVPVSAVAVEVDSSERPSFFAFPNIDYYSSFSSSVEVAGWGYAGSPTGARTNHVLCSIFSNPVYIIIKTWNIVIITPTTVIIM